MKKNYSLVILHGWGLSKARFEPLYKELVKRKYKTFSLDFPGFGQSKLPENPMTLTDYAHFLHEFVEKNRIQHPIFIGHSFGGRVTLRYNTLFPHDLEGIVLTGTPGFTPIPRKKLLLFIFFAKVGKAVFSLPFLSLLLEDIRKKYYYLVGAREFYRAEGSMRQTFKNVVQEQLVDDMKKISVPCLLLWGEEDTIVPVSIAQRMKETIKGSVLTILPKTSHKVPYSHPSLFSDEVDTFIASLN